jgi:hypothetical protein
VDHSPLAEVELRLGFQRGDHNFYHVLGALCFDGVVPAYRELPQKIEHFQWDGKGSLRVGAWLSAGDLSPNALLWEVVHDVPLSTEYVLFLRDYVQLEAGWWEALSPILNKGAEYIGRPTWHVYTQGQMDFVQGCPWYLGVAFERREGRAGVAYMSPGFTVVRSEGVRQANYLDKGLYFRAENSVQCGSEVLLGEIARQVGWTQEAHWQHAKIDSNL